MEKSSKPAAKSSFEEDLGDDFLSSWKPNKPLPTAALDFDDEPAPKNRKSSFSLAKMDMDFDFDGGFKALESFDVDMSDIDFPSTRKASKTKTSGQEKHAKEDTKIGNTSTKFSFDFNGFDDLDLDDTLKKKELDKPDGSRRKTALSMSPSSKYCKQTCLLDDFEKETSGSSSVPHVGISMSKEIVKDQKSDSTSSEEPCFNAAAQPRSTLSPQDSQEQMSIDSANCSPLDEKDHSMKAADVFSQDREAVQVSVQSAESPDVKEAVQQPCKSSKSPEVKDAEEAPILENSIEMKEPGNITHFMEQPYHDLLLNRSKQEKSSAKDQGTSTANNDNHTVEFSSSENFKAHSKSVKPSKFFPKFHDRSEKENLLPFDIGVESGLASQEQIGAKQCMVETAKLASTDVVQLPSPCDDKPDNSNLGISAPKTYCDKDSEDKRELIYQSEISGSSQEISKECHKMQSRKELRDLQARRFGDNNDDTVDKKNITSNSLQKFSNEDCMGDRENATNTLPNIAILGESCKTKDVRSSSSGFTKGMKSNMMQADANDDKNTEVALVSVSKKLPQSLPARPEKRKLSGLQKTLDSLSLQTGNTRVEYIGTSNIRKVQNSSDTARSNERKESSKLPKIMPIEKPSPAGAGQASNSTMKMPKTASKSLIAAHEPQGKRKENEFLLPKLKPSVVSGKNMVDKGSLLGGLHKLSLRITTQPDERGETQATQTSPRKDLSKRNACVKPRDQPENQLGSTLLRKVSSGLSLLSKNKTTRILREGSDKAYRFDALSKDTNLHGNLPQSRAEDNKSREPEVLKEHPAVLMENQDSAMVNLEREAKIEQTHAQEEQRSMQEDITHMDMVLVEDDGIEEKSEDYERKLDQLLKTLKDKYEEAMDLRVRALVVNNFFLMLSNPVDDERIQGITSYVRKVFTQIG